MGRFNIDYFKEVSEVGEAAISALEKQKDDPQKYQNEFLLKLISENKDTEYGIRYDFGNIKNVDDFRKKVPISEYDDYKAYIERMTEKKEKNLISAYRVAHYAMSSGSTGKSKAIPVTHNSCVFSSTFVGNAMFGYLNRELIRQNKKPGLVCALFDIALKHLEDNITIGAASTTIPYNFTDKIGGLFSSPLPLQCPEKTINEAMFLKALFALKERDLSCIDATFASVVVEFLKTIEADWQRLVTAVESGKLPEDL